MLATTRSPLIPTKLALELKREAAWGRSGRGSSAVTRKPPKQIFVCSTPGTTGLAYTEPASHVSKLAPCALNQRTAAGMTVKGLNPNLMPAFERALGD